MPNVANSPGPGAIVKPFRLPTGFAPPPAQPPQVQTTPAPSGSAGTQQPGGPPPLTPYGGSYPQPQIPGGGESPAEMAGLLDTTSLVFRPNQNIRCVVLTPGPTAPASSGWTSSGMIPSSFTVQDVLICCDSVLAASSVRFGVSRSAVVDGPSADSAQNLISPQSAGTGGAIRSTIPTVFANVPIYGLNAYVNDTNSRLWMEYNNGDISSRNCTILFTIVMEPGSETVQ